MAKQIPLTLGMSAIVDDGDAELVGQYKWFAHKSGTRYYAHTSLYLGGGREASKRYTLSMHRLIMGATDGQYVDHRDGDGLNNRRANLRFCTLNQNKMNAKPHQNRRSQFKGVRWHEPRQRWIARITAGGTRLYLGSFKDEETAARAYDDAARRHFGEFARPNFP